MKLRSSLPCLLLSYSLTFSATYMTDRVEVALRGTPSENGTYISAVRTGDELLVLGANGSNEWLQVQLKNGKTGWIKKKYVMNRATFESQIPALKKTNEELMAKLATVETEYAAVKDSLTRSRTDFSLVTKQYTDLKSGASNVIALQSAFDSIIVENDSLKKIDKDRLQEIDLLRDDVRMRWAIYGILFFMLSYFMGRHERKRKRGYNYR